MSITRPLAIDLGTATTLVHVPGEGLVIDEPSVLALDTGTGEILAMGDQAWAMLGRAPGRIQPVRPLARGVVADVDVVQRLLRILLTQAGTTRFSRPRLALCVPSDSNEVERAALLDAARTAGAADAHLVDQSLAAAIGAGLPLHRPVGTMVVAVGAGTTEAAVLSLGGVVALHASRTGSDDLDDAVRAHVRRAHGVVVGPRTAEEVKVSLGAAHPVQDGARAEVRGSDAGSGLPRTVVLEGGEVREAVADRVAALCRLVVACLGDVPPDLSRDLLATGVHLVGGGSLLAGLDARLHAETGLPVHRVAGARTCAVAGAARSLESPDARRVMTGG